MMDYNSYYPAQPGQPPPPPPNMMGNQHDCTMMGGQMMPSNGPTMMHSPAPSTPQSMRHTPGPQPMQQQPQPQHHHQQHIGHPMTPQQQPSPHPNYHQLPSHPPISHSASPHPSSTPHAQPQPPPRPATGPSPLHHQSPIHMNGPSPKIQTHGPMPPQSQLSNHMPSGIPGGQLQQLPVMPSTNHLPPHQSSHGPNFSGSPMPHNSSPHYGPPQPVNHHHHLPHPTMNHGPPPPPPMQTGPALGPPGPLPPGYMPSHPMHLVNQERGSPYYQHIPQTEFRIIELNKRLQSRPQVRGQASPLPLYGSSDESNWWERFVCDFFDDDSILTTRIPGEEKPIEYKIGRTLIPRFFRSYFEGGVTDLSIKLRNIRETNHSKSFITLDCEQADIITKHIFKQPGTNIYRNVVVHTEGHLSLEFVSNNFDQLMIKSWRFYANQCHEYIDRSMTNTGLPNTYLMEPVTRFGLTKSTSSYLRMCMVMEPMQDLMAHHIQTKMDPKSCLKHILFDRYKVKNIEPQPNKRRKRKAPAAAAGTTPRASPFSKKAKVNGANALNNNIVMNNNVMSANDIGGGLPLASNHVQVVEEPALLGDFGDENERRIQKLDNNLYDPTLDSNPPNDINNHQMNFPMNGETNHIVESELDLQPKQQQQQQTMASTQVGDPEVKRECPPSMQLGDEQRAQSEQINE